MKEIEYTIEAKLYFSTDEDVCISEYLDKLREIGEVRVVGVKIVER